MPSIKEISYLMLVKIISVNNFILSEREFNEQWFMKPTMNFLKYIKKISPSGLINRYCLFNKTSLATKILSINYSLAADREPISVQLWKTFFVSRQTFIEILLANFRSSPPEVFLKKGVLKIFWKYAANLQENLHAEVWFQ